MKKQLLSSASIALSMVMAFQWIAPAMAQVPFSGKAFTDVQTTTPGYEAIEYFRTTNVIRGYLDGTFRPNNRINRAEFLDLATNPFFLQGNAKNDCLGANVPPSNTHVFLTDVTTDDWYASAVCLGYIKHLISGYPDNTFRASRPINFAEASKIIVAALVTDFKNQDENSPQWYAPYIKALTDMKAVPASVRNNPAHIMTRSEVAQILYNVKMSNGMSSATAN